MAILLARLLFSCGEMQFFHGFVPDKKMARLVSCAPSSLETQVLFCSALTKDKRDASAIIINCCKSGFYFERKKSKKKKTKICDCLLKCAFTLV